jgi:hypothetical protein
VRADAAERPRTAARVAVAGNEQPTEIALGAKGGWKAMTGGSLIPESTSRRLVKFHSNILFANRRRSKATRPGRIARIPHAVLLAQKSVQWDRRGAA